MEQNLEIVLNLADYTSPVFFWTVIELALGVVCACLPTFALYICDTRGPKYPSLVPRQLTMAKAATFSLALLMKTLEKHSQGQEYRPISKGSPYEGYASLMRAL